MLPALLGPSLYLLLLKNYFICFNFIYLYRMSQNWRTNYLLPYRECLNVHEKNMEKMFPTKKSIIFIIIIINGNTI
jgi:hypothetical protein